MPFTHKTNGHIQIAAQMSGISNSSLGLRPLLHLVIACSASLGCITWANAQTTGIAKAWGSNVYTESTVPSSAATGVTAVAGGYYNTIALKRAGVIAWGNNANGQSTIPTAAATNVIAIASGLQHTIALKSDGSVLAWGFNDYGQCTLPSTVASGVTAIAGGGNHTVALKSGNVIACGYNDYGQCLGTDAAKNPITSIPAGESVKIAGQTLSSVTAIASGDNHTVALKNSAVIAWGANNSGQCDVPSAATSGVSAIACGGTHTVALKNGKVIVWGANQYGQCDAPSTTTSGVSAIAAGAYHTLALKNGGVVAWGYNFEGQCTVPSSSTTGVYAIACGSYHSMALYPITDCNNNDQDDKADIQNGLPDLNFDNIPDTCQGAVLFNVTTPSLGAPNGNVTTSYTFTELVMPDNFADVTMTIAAKGDLDAANEYITVSLNGVVLQRVFETGGANCATGLGVSNATVTIPFATFANAVALGQLTVSLLPSVAVSGPQCSTGYTSLHLKYVGIGPTGDCNENGLLDTRDLGVNPALDSNGNMHLDLCEMAKGDLDLSGSVDSGDTSLLLLNFDEWNPAFGDFDGNNVIDTGDVSYVLLNFGPVMWP